MTTPLHKVLTKHGITQTELSRSVVQKNGKSLGKTATNLLVRKGEFPKSTPRSAIELQVRDFLTAREITVPPNLFGDEDDGTAFIETEEKTMPVERLYPDTKRFFKLKAEPFTGDINKVGDLYTGSEQNYIQYAAQSTARHGGILAIIGESGAGKTTLRLDLEITAEAEKWPLVFIVPLFTQKTKLTSTIIDESIIRETTALSESKISRLSPSAKFETACRALKTSYTEGCKPVLIIEEAHRIPDNTLAELKQYWELRVGYENILSIILFGQPELKKRLIVEKNYQIRELINRCEIAEYLPLGKDIKPYLEFKFKRIGHQLTDIFEESAFDAIRQKLSKGGVSKSYPLEVNNLTIRCLNLAAYLNQLVDADVVKEA
jgi:type II secretory pathway predicted ATPase ExeA